MKYTLIEKIFVQGVGFLQGILLARLLSPEDFGLVAMLGIFLSVGTSLAESGLGSAYVVYGGDSRRVMHWNVGIAIILYAVLFCAAPGIALFYGNAILKELAWVMGLGIVLNAASVSRYASLQRAGRFRGLAISNCVSVFCAFLVGMTLAYYKKGVWAIAGVVIAGGIVKLAMLNFIRVQDDRKLQGGSFRQLFSYGWRMTVSSIVHTVYLNSYQLIIGKMLNPVAVGLFHRGQRWATLPVDVINDAVARVSLPSLASKSVSGRHYLILNVVLLWPCLAVLWMFAPWIVLWVLGEAWVDCVPYMRILIVGVFFTPVTNVALNYLRANGRADLILSTDVMKKPLQIGVLAVGVPFGIVGLCWSKVLSDFFEASVDCLYAWRLRRKLESMWHNLVKLRNRPEGRMLVQVHKERKVDQLLVGSNIAVVGNGPSEIGKGLGAEIDSHDIVIRFNNYKTDGFEKDYGSRCDIWMKGGASDVVHTMRPGVKSILYTDDIVDEGLLESNASFPAMELNAGIVVDYIDSSERNRLISAIGCRPSSGAILLNHLRNIPNHKVDVYGFSFLEDDKESGYFRHYAQGSTPDNLRYQFASAGHDIGKETQFLRSIVNGRTLKGNT